MKIACDICEKVEDLETAKNWFELKTQSSHMKLCEKCENSFWKWFSESKQKIKSDN